MTVSPAKPNNEEKRDPLGRSEVHYMPLHEVVRIGKYFEAKQKEAERMLADQQYLATHPAVEKDPIAYIELPD